MVRARLRTLRTTPAWSQPSTSCVMNNNNAPMVMQASITAAQTLIQSDRFPADKIVTHMLPLDRMTEAFDLMDAGECLKPCIDPRL